MNAARILVGTVLVLLLAFVGFTSAQGRKVSGTVVAAATGRPVPNASVRYEDVQLPPQTTETDAKGYFELPGGRLGVVTVTARDFGTASRRWPADHGGRLRIALVAPAVVDGTVRELVTGRAVEAMVTVMVRNADNTVSDTAVATNGVFTIDDLPSGSAVLLARAHGFAPFVGSLYVRAGRRRTAQVGLLLEGMVAGQVLEPDGSPAAGALIDIAYPGMAGGGLVNGFAGGRRVTGSDGEFQVNGLIPDTPIALEAILDGRRSAPVTVTVGPGMIQPGVELQLR